VRHPLIGPLLVFDGGADPDVGGRVVFVHPAPHPLEVPPVQPIEFTKQRQSPLHPAAPHFGPFRQHHPCDVWRRLNEHQQVREPFDRHFRVQPVSEAGAEDAGTVAGSLWAIIVMPDVPKHRLRTHTRRRLVPLQRLAPVRRRRAPTRLTLAPMVAAEPLVPRLRVAVLTPRTDFCATDPRVESESRSDGAVSTARCRPLDFRLPHSLSPCKATSAVALSMCAPGPLRMARRAYRFDVANPPYRDRGPRS